MREHLGDDEYFLASYGDTLTDADLPAMIERAKAAGVTASFLAARPNYSFHVVEMDDDGYAHGVHDVTRSDVWINGGFFVMRTEVIDHIGPGEDLVNEPFARLMQDQPGPGPAPRRLLGADGHAQGQAEPRAAARERHRPVAGLGPEPPVGEDLAIAAAG